MEKYYTYVLVSQKDGYFYIGYTSDLWARMDAHSKGLVTSTKYRRPLKLVYYEVCFNKESALKREKYLKTTYGHRYLKNRITELDKGILL